MEIVTILDFLVVLDSLTLSVPSGFFSVDLKRTFPDPLADFGKIIPLALLPIFLTISACSEDSSEKLPVTGIPALRILTSKSFAGRFNSFASSNTLTSDMNSFGVVIQFKINL